MTVTDRSGAGEVNYPLQFGRPFLRGAIPHAPQVLINGVPAPSQADIKNRHPDGSVEFAVIAVVVPSIPANGAVTLTFEDAATGNNTPLTQSQMLDPSFNFDAAVTFAGNPVAATPGTPSSLVSGQWPGSSRSQDALNAIANGGMVIPINGRPCNITGVNGSRTAPGEAPSEIVAQLEKCSGRTVKWTPNPSFWGMTLSIPSTTIGFASPPASGTDLSAFFALTRAGGASIQAGTPPTSAGPGMTTRISARTILQNGDYKLWTSGPVAQTVILGDDTARRKYDVGLGDGFHPIRPHLYATFWPATKQVFVRAVAESGLTTEYEDARYKITITGGASRPVVEYRGDLSGNLPNPVTGLALGPCTAPPASACSGSGYAKGYTGPINIVGTPSAPIPVTGNGHLPGMIGRELVDLKNQHIAGQLYLYDRAKEGSPGWGALNAGTPVELSASWPKTHWAGSAWTRQFWLGGTPRQQVDIDNNLAYLESTRFIPNFDPDTRIDPVNGIAHEYANWSQYANDIYDGNWNNTGVWNSYMGSPGARQDIAPYPTWTVLWLYTGDWRMRTMALGMSDLAVAWSYHLRETDPGRILNRGDKPGSGTGLGHEVSIIGRPTLLTWGGDLGYDGTKPQDKINVVGPYDYAANPWVIEGSHQPAAFYPQYILTGDPFYLNEMEMFAGNGVARYTPDGNGPGARGPDGTWGAVYDELRGHAWVYRDRAEAAFAEPDGVPEKRYLTAMMNDAIARDEGGLQITGTPYDGSFIKNWGKAKGNYFTSQQNLAFSLSPIGMWWTSGQTTSWVTGATVVSGGSGGRPGPVTIKGTSGWGNRFQARGTISSAGALTGPLTILNHGSYGALPTNTASEPVVAVSGGSGLVGARVSIGESGSSCQFNDSTANNDKWFQPGSCGAVTDVWTQWYLQYGLGRAAELGFAATPVTEWGGRFLINALEGGEPKLITMYEQPATHLPSSPDDVPTYFSQWSASAAHPSYVDASATAPIFVVDPGSRGTPGPVTITGTTGTGTMFVAAATINSAGQLSGPIRLLKPGAYRVDPKYSAREPVRPVSGGGGLEGATVALPMSDIEGALDNSYLYGASNQHRQSLQDYWAHNMWSQGRPAYAMAALALLVDEGAPGAAQAWPWIKANVHDVIGANIPSNFPWSVDPSFDIVPRTDHNTLPAQPTSPQ